VTLVRTLRPDSQRKCYHGAAVLSAPIAGTPPACGTERGASYSRYVAIRQSQTPCSHRVSAAVGRSWTDTPAIRRDQTALERHDSYTVPSLQLAYKTPSAFGRAPGRLTRVPRRFPTSSAHRCMGPFRRALNRLISSSAATNRGTDQGFPIPHIVLRCRACRLGGHHAHLVPGQQRRIRDPKRFAERGWPPSSSVPRARNSFSDNKPSARRDRGQPLHLIRF
jgi:hypothetical protein